MEFHLCGPESYLFEIMSGEMFTVNIDNNAVTHVVIDIHKVAHKQFVKIIP